MSVQEYGLADSPTKEEFNAKLSALSSKWNAICPGFHKWFSKKRKETFEECVIEAARETTGIDGLYYTNDVECMHFMQFMVVGSMQSTLNMTNSLLKMAVGILGLNKEG